MLASFFIQHITAGGAYVDKSMYCAQISDLISAIIIYLCGFVLFMKHAMNSRHCQTGGEGGIEGQGSRERSPAESEKGGDQVMVLLLQYTLIFASVLILVALGGCFSEHSGVINLGLEGIMIMGALGGALAMRYIFPRLMCPPL